MLVAVFSAKGSPGVTSASVALAAVWPRPVVLLEADPSGSDLTYRCRTADGEPIALSRNVLGLASSARGENTTELSDWTQQLGCDVDVVPGVTTPSQARGVADLWPQIAPALQSCGTDAIVDLGRLTSNAPTAPLADVAEVHVPVVAATVESFVHVRELLKDLPTGGRATTVPLLVGRGRSAAADCADLDEVLAGAGLLMARSTHLPFDHPGLAALLNGANPAGRGRGSQLVRGARGAVAHIRAAAGAEVPA